MGSIAKKKALQRLQKDLEEVTRLQHELPSISALPLENDIFEWHCNLLGEHPGPYADIVLHLILEFPNNYPFSPPTVRVTDNIEHPNVFGQYICLDMLEEGEFSHQEEKRAVATGWTSCYSVVSILRQLQAFLFEGADGEYSRVQKTRWDSMRHKCEQCGHDMKQNKICPPFGAAPDIEVPHEVVDKQHTTEAKANGTILPVSNEVDNEGDMKNGIPMVDDITKKKGKGVTSENNDYYRGGEKVESRGHAKGEKKKKDAIQDVGSWKEGFEGDKQQGDELRVDADEVVDGRVKSVVPFGVFVDIGARRDALLHIKNTEPAGHRFSVGDRITARIQSIDPVSNKIALTQKAHLDLHRLMATREPIEGQVTSVKPFGMFVQIGDHNGLVHRSNMELYPNEPIPYIPRQSVSVRILEVEPKLKLTCRILFLIPDLATPEPLPLPSAVDLQMVCCFHNKKRKEEVTLGVGVAMEEEQTPNGPPKKYLTSIFDFLSSEAFQDGVRMGVWKHPFSLFLPLCVDEAHFEKTLPWIKYSIAMFASPKIAEATRSCGKKKIDDTPLLSLDQYREAQKAKNNRTSDNCGEDGASSSTKAEVKPKALFEAVQILEVLPKLMNSQVVLLMSGCLWTSEKALMGYMAFHHLFLALVDRFPSLRVEVDRRLEAFITTEEGRHKDSCSNLGEFLCLLSVSDTYTWDDLCEPLLEEVFVRHALWALKQYPGLVKIEDIGVSPRMGKTFKANIVSLKLLMFQVSFFLRVKGKHSHAGIPSCSKASCRREAKDATNGLPTDREVREIFHECKTISALSTYDQFFHAMRVGPVAPFDLCRWLRRAMLHSLQKGYHRSWQFERLLIKKQKPADGADGEAGDSYDPDDFAMDTRAKKTQAEKRAARENAAQCSMDHFRSPLFFGRKPGGNPVLKNMVVLKVTLDAKSDLDHLLDNVKNPPSGTKYKLKDAKTVVSTLFVVLEPQTMIGLERTRHSYPLVVKLGRPCKACKRAIEVDVHTIMCPDCFHRERTRVSNQPIKGLTTKDRSTNVVSQALVHGVRAPFDTPSWELTLDLPMQGGLLLKSLRKCIDNDLTFTSEFSDFHRLTTFVQHSPHPWKHKSPETVIPVGARIVATWSREDVSRRQPPQWWPAMVNGRPRLRRRDITIGLDTDEDLNLVRFRETTCKAHEWIDWSKKREYFEDFFDDNYDVVCKNCRGKVVFHIQGPRTYALRERQLKQMNTNQLGLRAQLLGLELSNKDEMIRQILKAERIIR